MLTSRSARFRNRRVQIAALSVAAAGIAMIFGPASAAPRATTAPSSYTVAVPDSSYAATAYAAVSGGDALRLAATTSDWDALWLRSQCYQNGDRVYIETLKVVAGGATLTLGPTASWTGGAADCVADVGHFFVNKKGLPELRVEGTDSFRVAG